MKYSFVLLTILFTVVGLVMIISEAEAAALSLSPSGGTFSIGSTFDVSVFLDTQDESINAIDMKLIFPPEILQVVSPSTGHSIIGVWTAPPYFNNQIGEIILRGGMPGGINASQGLVSTVSFRVKQVGSAIVKFSDTSKVLLNDGSGTDVLENTRSGVYRLTLPPPAGPIVASETHPDGSRWYSNPNVVLAWTNPYLVEGYSYMLSEEPIDVPDDISEGARSLVAYKNLADGRHYLHIKALRDGNWGGVTHFTINVDTEPPADFDIEIQPNSRTINKNPIIKFLTTDRLSGIDHYEYKIVSLHPDTAQAALLNTPNENFFIEGQSPIVLSSDIGDYDVIVRAYDKAGNFREVTQRLAVVTPILQALNGWSALIAIIIIAFFIFLALRIRRWHHGIIAKSSSKELPNHIKQQLDELRKYRKRYGHVVLLMGLIGLIGLIGPISHAQQLTELSPPFVSTVSRNISNDEIFYIGGKTDVANLEVIIYFQNLQTGETITQSVTSNKKGEWFYRHPTFLSTGNYLLWTQTKLGDQMSPPGPQIQMQVRPTAIQFGASRLSYETLYQFLAIIFLLATLGLIGYISYHAYHGRQKHKEFWKEVREAEESIRRGFAVLRRDIEAELAVIKKAKLNKSLFLEEQRREEQLLKDLDWVQKYIGKEIWDIEETGR